MKARTVGAAVAAVCAAIAFAATGSGASTSPYAAPTVAVPVAPGSVSAGYGTGAEPRMLITAGGDILVAAHMSQWDCVTGQPSPGKGHQCIWRSTDHGRSFHFLGGEPNQRGDDVDLAESGGVLLESTMTNVGLGTGVGGTTVTRSTDKGKTWSESIAVNKSVLNDRPFMLSTPDGGVVLTYLSLPGGLLLVRSTDNGLTWGLPQPVHVGRDDPILALNGAPAVDPLRKQIIVPYATSGSPTCTAGAQGCLDTFSVARGNYDGTGFVSEPILTTQSGTGTSSLVSAAADAAGTEYVSISTASGGSGGGLGMAPNRDGHITLYSQRAGAKGWVGRQVDPNGGTAILPNLAASRAGHVVVAYYWSPFRDALSKARPWYVVVADSHDSGKTYVRSTVSSVVWTGAGVDHQVVLWDLFGVALDRNDKVNVAWTQVAKPSPEGPLTEIAFARQR